VLQVFVVTIYGTIMLFLMLNVLYIYISTPQSMYVVPSLSLFCRSLILCFPIMLHRYSWNDSAMVPIAPIIIGITYFYIPHALFITTTTTILLNFSARFTEKVLDCYERKRNVSYSSNCSSSTVATY
jgi:uncharacterized membrane protein